MTEPCYGLLLLSHLRVQNANAISGPLSWGFPAPSAFTGFAHALQRRFAGKAGANFGGVGIVCHAFEPQVSRPAGRRTLTFNLTRNPNDKDGDAPALIEEGRAHLDVSLVIGVRDYLPQDEGESFAAEVLAIVSGMRLAGGSLQPAVSPARTVVQWWPLSGYAQADVESFRKLSRRLLPGFALVHRPDLLIARLNELREAEPDASAHAALLDLVRLNIEPQPDDADQPDACEWGIRRRPGWLVPLPIGYAALSPLYPPGSVERSRDTETPFRFVESLYSLGEWVSPHRLSTLEQLFWTHETDLDAGLYCCRNRYADFLARTA